MAGVSTTGDDLLGWSATQEFAPEFSGLTVVCTASRGWWYSMSIKYSGASVGKWGGARVKFIVLGQVRGPDFGYLVRAFFSRDRSWGLGSFAGVMFRSGLVWVW